MTSMYDFGIPDQRLTCDPELALITLFNHGLPDLAPPDFGIP